MSKSELEQARDRIDEAFLALEEVEQWAAEARTSAAREAALAEAKHLRRRIKLLEQRAEELERKGGAA